MAEPPPPFRSFGPDHLGALAVTAVAACLLCRFARAHRGERRVSRVRRGLALVQLANLLAVQGWLAWTGQWVFTEDLPCHLCDAAAMVAILALWWPAPLFVELLYFWGLAGTIQALATPDITAGFPALPFFSYFVQHSAIVVSALFLVCGVAIPRRGAVVRVWLWTNAYAAVVALVNVATGANYLYLREKPSAPSLLDAMGPWPWYILSGEVLAFALFLLLDLPFVRSRRHAGQ